METGVTREGLESIAVIGMAGRFPGARNLREFWANLRDGVESISHFTPEELLENGVDPALVKNPSYIRAKGVVEGADLFDAAFFGYTPAEAQFMDPQHRLFLECGWEALESAGYDSERYRGSIGVYAGASLNTYLLHNAYHQLHSGKLFAFDKDFLTTRLSYKLDLKGPSVVVQTACSTSLVAICQACQSLLNYQCDMALAGGVSLSSPIKTGYLYREGGIGSPDGHCRAFDAEARGTVGGTGVAIVVLKRLSEALSDGDTVLAVIKGFAINNDGAVKIGYTAPGIEGQAEVIAMAQALGGIEADSITYIETHGTGTELGDPIEIAALTRAFRNSSSRVGTCAIGSVKTNIGHLDAAAGVAGLIKTVLALREQKIPPSLHYRKANPKIDFAQTPFYVNTTLNDWKPPAGGVRRAGVSSFGIGGTNAHVVLEEAPAAPLTPPIRSPQLLLLSARTETALETMSRELASHLRERPDLDLADVATTLQVGRRRFEHRRMLVARTPADAAEALAANDPERVLSSSNAGEDPSCVFMFPGQGSQHVGMARGLYQRFGLFRDEVDRCASILEPLLGLDLRKNLFATEAECRESAERLRQTALAQVALFVVEQALARLWMSWGVMPDAAIGHSIGEYVAASLAGVFSLEDALRLVALRGRLMQAQPPGTMLSVPMGPCELEPLLTDGLSLAAVNAPSLCVVAGPEERIDALAKMLAERSHASRRLHTSHAFHSEMMEAVVEPFERELQQVELARPKLPFVSNVTGEWITVEQATDPRYWARHLRQAVRFSEGVRALLERPGRVFLELGPGSTLTSLVRQHLDPRGRELALAVLPNPKEERSDEECVLHALGRGWMAGLRPDWSEMHAGMRRRRIPLPTYPFERERFWLEPIRGLSEHAAAGATRERSLLERASLEKGPDHREWCYLPGWRSTPPAIARRDGSAQQARSWLVFADGCGLGERLAERLAETERCVIRVQAGARYAALGNDTYVLDPRSRADYELLLEELERDGKGPERIIHAWAVTGRQTLPMARLLDLGFYSLLHLAQALARCRPQPRRLYAITDKAQPVTGGERLEPAKAALLGPCRVIPQELSGIVCASIDIDLLEAGGDAAAVSADKVVEEVRRETVDPEVAYRGHRRWVPAHALMPAESGPPLLRERGVYLITGGLGGVGLILAEHLARKVRGRLVLTSRSSLPAREVWGEWLATHDAQDGVATRITKLLELEALGADIMVRGADVADAEEMRSVIEEVQQRFGALNGVIHAAGVVRGRSFAPLQELHRDACEEQFKPKLGGVLALEKALEGRSIDFCMLVSSLASVLGGLGFAAYAASNRFIDVFTQQQRQRGRPWFSVNWDAWQLRETAAPPPAGTVAALAMTRGEGTAVFDHLLHDRGLSQIIVSTADLERRLRQWVDLQPEQAAAATPAHQRPRLSRAYVAPRNETEQQLAALWSEMFGIAEIGIHDNFFELGGHSLMAIQLVPRIRERFGVELPVPTFFELATIEKLSKHIDALTWVRQEPAPAAPHAATERDEIDL
ncbi:MAG: SDR family NAD(P)-dependent oxidoreductase [Planctomycetota bacterium]